MYKKWISLLALVLCLSFPVMAKDKDKGVEMNLENWGIITVPTDLIMQQGTQPFLTARTYNNDVTRMLEEIYPVQPVCWQLVQKDDANFQYAYLLRYSVSIWQVEAAADGRQQMNPYLRDIGSRPDLQTVVSHANNRLRLSLPSGFELTQPFTSRKIKGTTFYESTVIHKLLINESYFTETIYTLAFPHGNKVEIAVLIGHKDFDNDVLDHVAGMLKNAKKMPRK